MLSFFVFLLKMITTISYNTQKISIGSLQEKKSRDGKKYQNIPILYDGRRNALVHLCGRFQLVEDLFFDDFGDISHSLVIEVDDDNRKFFEDFENQLMYFLENYPGEPWPSITTEDISLIEGEMVYLKIYLSDEGKTGPKFWKVNEKEGKEYKERIWDTESLVWTRLEGEIMFSIENIFVEKNSKRKARAGPKSIICVAKEIMVREIMESI